MRTTAPQSRRMSMDPDAPARSTIAGRKWYVWAGVYLAFWTALGLMGSTQIYLGAQTFSREPWPWSRALAFGITDMYILGAVALLALLAARAINPERYRWPQFIGLHLIFATAALVAGQILNEVVRTQLELTTRGVLEGLARSFTPRLVTYLAFVGASYAIVYSLRQQERELRESKLREELANVRLGHLKLQLQPHFLFNTLHSISSLMHRDPDSADKILTRLADLLRNTINAPDTQVVPLDQELQELQPYLEIEQIRFGERLDVTVDIEEAGNPLVPHMMLQPLVENAIRHGISPSDAGGKVVIRAERDEQWLDLRVTDDGVGLFESDEKRGHGVGLGNTRRRLAHLYGERQSLDLYRDSDITVVRIRIPYSEAAAILASAG